MSPSVCPASVKPPNRGPPPVISPEIKADHSATFRLKAPNAKAVYLCGLWMKEPLPLTLGDDGVWSGRVAAIPAGVWEYNFSVDGVTLIDPGNPAIKPMRERRASILHVAGSPPQP